MQKIIDKNSLLKFLYQATTTSFQYKKAALLGISSGVMGGALALSHLTDILNYLNMHVFAVKPRIQRMSANFINGEITDKFIAELIDAQVKGFINF